jgi:hypothetical protein
VTISHWSIRLSRAALSMAGLPIFPLFSSLSNACANFEICERSGTEIRPRLATDLALRNKRIRIPLKHGGLVVSCFQVRNEFFQVFREHIHLFGERRN